MNRDYTVKSISETQTALKNSVTLLMKSKDHTRFKFTWGRLLQHLWKRLHMPIFNFLIVLKADLSFCVTQRDLGVASFSTRRQCDQELAHICSYALPLFLFSLLSLFILYLFHQFPADYGRLLLLPELGSPWFLPVKREFFFPTVA